MTGKKKLIIGGSAAIAVIAIVVVALLMIFNKEDAYRVIKVLEIDGTASVERENVGELQVYSGMALQSGDKISVASNSMLVLQMDDDKYAYVEQNSILTMVAEGTSRDSKTMIQLDRGAITCQLENKLSESSSYEVQTQNSVMAVRGTVFRVGIYEPEKPELAGEEAQAPIVQLAVMDGDVLVTLIHPNGQRGEERMVSAGESAAIGSDSTDSFFLGGVDLDDLPLSTNNRQFLEALQDIMDRGDTLSITREELEQFIEELDANAIYNVYFYANGKLFGVQSVQAGQTAQKPSLSPTASGVWNIDFTKEITGDTDVYWVAE